MLKRGKPFFLPLAKRQKPKSGAQFPGSPFSVSGWDTGFIGFTVSFVNPDDLRSSASRSRRSRWGNR